MTFLLLVGKLLFLNIVKVSVKLKVQPLKVDLEEYGKIVFLISLFVGAYVTILFVSQ